MLKIFFSCLALTSVLVGNAQQRPHNIAFGFSNNGQLARSSNDFYFRPENMMAVFTPSRILSKQQSAFKATVEYSFQSAQNIEFGLTAGYALRKDKNITDVSDVSASQQFVSLLPFVLKNWTIGSLQLSMGGGIPIYMAGKFRASYREYSTGFPETIIADNTLDGGNAFGLSAIGRVKWFLNPHLSVMTTIQFGALYSDFGGNYSVVTANESYPLYFAPSERRQTTFSLPTPEFSVGIGFRI